MEQHRQTERQTEEQTDRQTDERMQTDRAIKLDGQTYINRQNKLVWLSGS